MGVKLVGMKLALAPSGEIALLYLLILLGIAMTIAFWGKAVGRIDG